MIRQGILLFANSAAGLRAAHTRLAALPLLDRGIRTLARAGVQRLLVVVPTGTNILLCSHTQRLEIELEIATWEALPTTTFFPSQDFVLLLGNYVHHYSSLSDLLRDGLGEALLVYQINSQHSPKPASKMTTGHTAIIAGSGSNEIPTTACSGVFRVAAGRFTAQDLALAGPNPAQWLYSRNDLTLETATTPPLWHSVSEPGGATAAKNMLFAQVTKKTSGFVSRHLNARISIPTSKLLIETGISPHMVTILLVLTSGLAAACLVTQANNYAHLVVAGILWQFAAIFDRCDGEIARVKLCESQFGAWFDTITDNVAYVCAYVGMLVGLQKRHPQESLYTYVGISAIVALLFTLSVLYAYARKTGSGSLQTYLQELILNVPKDQRNMAQQLMVWLGFAAKRDFFSFIIFVTALANSLEIAYWYLVVVLHLAAAGVLLSQRKMLHAHSKKQSGKPIVHDPDEKRS